MTLNYDPYNIFAPSSTEEEENRLQKTYPKPPEKDKSWDMKQETAERLIREMGSLGYVRKSNRLWEIRGEDANADLGGPHSEPLLATVEGTLEEAAYYAVDLKGFFTWGRGGTLKPYDPTQRKIIKLDAESMKKQKVLQERKEQLKKELEQIDKELKCQ